MIVLRLFVILGLIGINAFFSAVEFSLVAVRPSRIRQLVQKGVPRAQLVESLLNDLRRVISGVQVGITLASLALGYLGEITLADILSPHVGWIPGRFSFLAAHTAALVLAFGFLTVLQVVLGELVPKGVSLARAERVALLVSRPFSWFLRTFRGTIDLLDGIAAKVVRLMGVAQRQGHSVVRSSEELRILVEQARERGFLQPAEVRFIQRVMELGNVQVRELMVPRPDMHVLPVGASLEEVMNMFAVTQRSRLPIYEGTLDHIIGFVHIKDMVWALLDRAKSVEEGHPEPEFHLRRLLREVTIVPETKPASELLLELRARRTGLAMVVDEFGTILGLATLEDILEQMVGEIHDEFDVIERPLTLADGTTVFDAALNIRDLKTQFGISLPDDPAYETLGGFVLSRLGFIPRGGESFETNGYRFTVMEVDHRRVSRVKIRRLSPLRPGFPPAGERAEVAAGVVRPPAAAAVPGAAGGTRKRKRASAKSLAKSPTKE